MGRFDDFKVGLSYKQKQRLEKGRIKEILAEKHDEFQQMLKFDKVFIVVGVILFCLGVCFIFVENIHSLISITLSSLGAGLLTGSISGIRRTRSDSHNLKCLKKELEKSDVI